MKVKIMTNETETLFEGKYLYLEGGTTDGKPSFHLEIDGEKENGEVFCFFESKEELKEFMGDLTKIHDSIQQ